MRIGCNVVLHGQHGQGITVGFALHGVAGAISQ
jgi:hypothetical protein